MEWICTYDMINHVLPKSFCILVDDGVGLTDVTALVLSGGSLNERLGDDVQIAVYIPLKNAIRDEIKS